MQQFLTHRRRSTFDTASVLLISVLVGASLSPTTAADILRSPWDMPPPQSDAVPTPCPQPPALTAGIDAASYYVDSARSIADKQRKAEYEEAVDPLRDAATTMAAMADRYRDTGDRSAAQCAISWLAKFASGGVLTGAMATSQSVYVQGWIMGAFAVVALKVRTGRENDSEWRRIGDWLAGVADAQVAYYQTRTGRIDGRNNHRYWSGFAVMAAGIASGHRDLFDWGEASFRIGAAQITPNGTLPLEMQRRARALHYHLFAAAPLVMMAELAIANGVDLYADNDHALSRLLHCAFFGIKNPSYFSQQVGIAQEPARFDAADVAWAAPYGQRFNDAAVAELAAQARSAAFVYLGGKPPKPVTKASARARQ